MKLDKSVFCNGKIRCHLFYAIADVSGGATGASPGEMITLLCVHFTEMQYEQRPMCAQFIEIKER